MMPELFRVPYIDAPVYGYGLCLFIGFMLGLWLTGKNAAGDGLDKERIYALGISLVLTALLGAKLMMFIQEWRSAAGHSVMAQVLQLWQSGGVYYGGFIMAFATGWWLVRRWALPTWKIADACAPAGALGHAVGRLGCFAAGCCWGTPTDSWIGVHFTTQAHVFTGVPVGVRLHPAQLYEAAAEFSIFLFLVWLRNHRAYPGQVMAVYIFLYAVSRFILEFWRGDPRGWIGPCSTSQFMALVLGTISVSLLLLKWRGQGGGQLRHRAISSVGEH